MELVIMYLVAIAAVGIVGFMLVKKMDIKISLFLIGIVLMYIALLMGKDISVTDFVSSGVTWLDPFKVVGDQFVSTLTSAGFIILILGGYTGYMSHIGANEVTVSVLAKPIAHIKSHILVPITFLLGNLLSLVIPSASNLAIILMATLYPVLRQAGEELAERRYVIATTATIMPTPLGSDNVAIAAELAKTDMFSGSIASDKSSVMPRSFPSRPCSSWHWHTTSGRSSCKRAGSDLTDGDVDLAEVKAVEGSALYRTVYAILPLLPIVMLLIVFVITSTTGAKIDLSVELASILSFVIAIICELIRTRSGRKPHGTESPRWAGGAMPIVALLVAASVFVVGLKSIGLITELQNAMTGLSGSGMGFVLPLILVGLTALIVLLSGSGTALFFAMVPLMVPLAAAAGINVLAVSIPMGLAGNLLRAVSPVSAVVMIVAGSIKKSPIDIVRRTSVPMIAGVIVMFILSMAIFLPMGA